MSEKLEYNDDGLKPTIKEEVFPELPQICDVFNAEESYIKEEPNEILSLLNIKDVNLETNESSKCTSYTAVKHIKQEQEIKPFIDEKDLIKQHTKVSAGRENSNKESYKCVLCKKRFKSLKIFRSHVKSHFNEESYKCRMCCKQFLKVSSLMLHIRFHSRMSNISKNDALQNRKFKNQKAHYSCSNCKKAVLNKQTLLHQLKICTCEKSFEYYTSKRGSLKWGIKAHKRKSSKCNICNKYFQHHGNLLIQCRRHIRKGQLYECSQCKKRFLKWSAINQHLRIHVDNKPHISKAYNKQMKDRYKLKQHVRIHTGEKPHVCNVSEKCFTHQKFLKLHPKAHFESNSYECGVCEITFPNKKDLVFHLQGHKCIQLDADKQHNKCLICKKHFSAAKMLKKHMKIHSYKRYKCEICKKQFTKRDHLEIHIRVHTGERPYKCEICTKCFFRRDSLRKHIRIHTGERPYKCEICDKRFSERGNLQRHIRIHTNERPFKCEICVKHFRERGSLQSHIRTHTNEKPFKCEICDKCFISQRTLQRHIRSHSKEKPYKCEICEKCFGDRGYVRRHIRAHSKENRYNCEICGMCFGKRVTLASHMKTHNK